MTERDQEMLRRYLLGTLPGRARRKVEARIETEQDWAEALAQLREDMDQLDGLPSVEAPEVLDTRILERLNRPEATRRTARLLRPAFGLAAAFLLLFAGTLAFVLYAEFRAGEREHLAELHLKHIGFALKLYSSDSRGERFPPLAPYEDVWIFDVALLYPKYLSEIRMLAAPNRPGYAERAEKLEALVAESPIDWEQVARIAGAHFAYTGWSVAGAQDAAELPSARRKLAKADYDQDLSGNNRTFYRLREGIERFFITDINNPASSVRAQSGVPILVQFPAGAAPGNTHVLYLDGHVASMAEEGQDGPASALVKAIATPGP